MIRISQLKLDYRHDDGALLKKITAALRINEQQLISYEIVRRSIDARKKGQGLIFFVYTVDVTVTDEDKVLQRIKDKNITKANPVKYEFKSTGTVPLKTKPIIIGSGPAGLMCGLFLARAGYKPIIIEQGEDVDSRRKTVEDFWNGGNLNPQSNVQFGEGGAGTFSDGKLNTLIKDKTGKNKAVLQIFSCAGASKEILYTHKPHIGTDVLAKVVKNIRQEIIAKGGQVIFGCKLKDIHIKDGQIEAIEVIQNNQTRLIETNIFVAAIGHSARDTFEMFHKHNVYMTPKPFAIGVRMEHLQSVINMSQYGMETDDILGAADYKLTYETAKGRNVYTFCMCPGGYVVNASSEEGRTTVNGMSYSGRDSDNANSAVIVNVTPEDFESSHPLAGMAFQRHWEEQCFKAAGGTGKIPVQLFKDFKTGNVSQSYGHIKPVHKGLSTFADLNQCLPAYVCESLVEAIEAFGGKIKGYNHDEALLSGIEARTSSPVRIVRDESLQSNIKGLYPCGEGAGYAGGITSAAMDGIKVAEAIGALYAPWSDYTVDGE